MAMEFWGLEVKPGESVKCVPSQLGEEKFLHISQASLGEVKKDKAGENIPIFVHINNAKLVLGTLSAERCLQISLDLVFEKEFELSHGSKNASVYFLGYKSAAVMSDSELSDDFSESDSEDDLQISKEANGKPESKDDGAKPVTGRVNIGKVDASVGKAKAKIDEEPKKSDKPKADDEDDDDDDSEGDESEEDESDDGDDEDIDMSDEDDGTEDENEATPKKTASGKKRAAESAARTPVPEKKAKIVTPAGGQKTGGEGKKGGHTATPHPAKQTGKTPGNTDKGKQQTPKSAGSVSCKSCSKSFNSENALQAHTKAKHSSN